MDWCPGTEPRTRSGPGLCAAVLPAADGRVLVVGSSELELLDLDDGTRAEVHVNRPLCPGVRFSDAACDPAGRLLVGSTAGIAATGQGGLHRVEADGSLTTLLSGTTLSNGLGWDPSGRSFYFADSAARTVTAYDYDVDDGALTAPRELCRFEGQDGAPDGLCVDADGRVWVASFGGGFVRCVDPAGRTRHVVRLPVSNVTSCTFGGDAMDVLYVTTASVELTPEAAVAEPHAGKVFACRPGAVGLPEHSWPG